MRIRPLLFLLGLVSAFAEFPAHATEVREIVDRIESFMASRKNADGITPDLRATEYPTELIRLSVAPQLLAYHELYRVTADPRMLAEETTRADYLVRNFASVRRHKAYDGMISYALLMAHQASGNPVYRRYAEEILEEMMRLPPEKLILNTGLMTAMGLAKANEVAPRARIKRALIQILDNLVPMQNADGSFPHAYAYDGTDLHYSGWMAMQLMLIQDCRGSEDLPQIKRMLPKLVSFVQSRINMDGSRTDLAVGEPKYEDTHCSHPNRCTRKYYYARMTSTQPEYDTRGWINELGYEIFVFDRSSLDTEKRAVTDFLASIENNGAFPDKWAYPADPIREPAQYPFAIESRSVVRTSLLFWELAATLKSPRVP